MNIYDMNHEFEEANFLVFSNENKSSFKEISDCLSHFLNKKTGVGEDEIENLHHFIEPKEINSIRMEAFAEINNIQGWENKYLSLANERIQNLMGPDVSIQIKLNLSIQMPNDKTSILKMHTDTMSGQSPYECVLWTALTDTFDTNAMYMFDKEKSQKILIDLPNYQHEGVSRLFEDNKEFAEFLEVEKGTCILFSSTLFHGNLLNKTDKTRISINCRFKSLFSPEYSKIPHERVTGTFYKPLKVSPLTKLGLNYNDHIQF